MPHLSDSAKLRALPTMAQLRAKPVEQPKGTPGVLVRQEKRAAQETAEETCRKAVWKRDGRTSRASGHPLVEGHVDPDKRGEVAHLTARSTHPAEKHKPYRCVLLSATEHQLSDARTAGAKGQALLEIQGTDGRKRLTFIRRDRTGTVLWRRSSRPPGTR